MKTHFFLYLLAVALVFTGCEKSFETFTPNPSGGTPTDTTWANTDLATAPINALHESLIGQFMVDSFSVLLGGIVEFAENTRIEIPALGFSFLNGALVDGKAQIEIRLLKKKGDLIRFRKPTTSNGFLLESGGVLYVNVTKNGQPLRLLSGRFIKVNFRDAAPNLLMKGFTGVGSNLGNVLNVFNWLPADSISVRPTTASGQTIQTGYEVFTNKLQWINCDYFRDTADVKTRIALSMPIQFTNTNTSSFIVYKNIRSVMQFNSDVANKIWRKDLVPINKAVIYITISKTGNDSFWLGVKESTTAINQNIIINPEPKTMAQINAYLDSL